MSERMPIYFPLKQAAEIANCHADTLRRAIKRGKLRYNRAGNRYRLSLEQIKEYMESGCHEQGQTNPASSSEGGCGATNTMMETPADAFRRARQIDKQL